MKVIVSQPALLNALKKMNGLVGSGKIEGSWAGILIEAANDTLTIKGNGLECNTKGVVSCKVITEGSCCPHYSQLLAIVDSFDEELEMDVVDSFLVIKCGNQTVKLATQPTTSFGEPAQQLRDIATTLSIGGESLKRTLTLVTSLLEKELTIMAGINLRIDEGRLIIMGGSTTLVGIFELDCHNEALDPSLGLNFTLHPSLIKGVLAMCDDGTIVIEDGSTGCVRFSSYNYQLTCSKMAGVYPQMQKIIPQEIQNYVIVNADKVVDALRRVEILAQSGRPIVEFQLKDFAVQYLDVINNPIRAKVKSDFDRITFDYHLLQKALRCLRGETMKLEMQNKAAPAFIREEGMTLIVSPCVK